MGRELLRVIRPDLSSITRARIVIWSLAVVTMMPVIYFNLSVIHEHPIFYSSLAVLIYCFLFLCLHVVINTHPIIFTETGLIQAWTAAFLWEDIEEYRWFPVSKHFNILRVFPSNSMPISKQLNNIKGGFGLIHDDYKSKIEELFRQKRITEQKWD